MTRRRKKPKPQAPRRPLPDFRNVAHGKARLAEMIAESEKRDESKTKKAQGRD